MSNSKKERGVTRASSGRYFCEAGNSEGTTRSAPFQLRVKFEPVCGEGGGRKVLGAAKGEPLRIECKVDAEPAASLFRWIFNSTPGVSRELSEFTAEPGSSILTYTPSIAAHYGTLQCWGRNELGSQQTPCVYHIVPAGRPDPPNGCAVSNTTHHSVTVNCKKGFDGGLRQKFVLLVSVAENLTANLSSSVPEFQISNLDATTEYIATAYSVNAKGWSKASNSILIKTLPSPGLKELRRSTGPSNEEKAEGPWLYILLAAGSTLIVAGAIGVIIFAVKRIKIESPVRERRSRSPKRDELPLNPQVSAYTDTVNDDKNPDLIPPPDYESLHSDPTTAAPYTITARPSTKRNCATQMPVKPYHVTWAPMLQSRNCSTQTPPPHKESSV
ncbi:nephrin-like [Photinus pyralis]|uniref:nephrin-like n=1 Tax=Photinus pyralis TaxID=7054 RepID=UPI00126758AD|nr:nephrin-like [Photinus pyralis]